MSAASLHTLRNGLETARDYANEAQKSSALTSQMLRAGHFAKAREKASESAQQTAAVAFLISEYLGELESLETTTEVQK